MRHKKAGRQFGRDTSSRRAMLRNLTANLITHERIETTDAKAKELRRVAERLITKATRLGKIAYTAQAELSAADIYVLPSRHDPSGPVPSSARRSRFQLAGSNTYS